MFGKRKSSLLVPTNEKFDTLVGKTTEIVGKVILAESLRIDGKISGNIECQPDAKVTVAIGQDGEVVGDIHAYRVVVAGKVEGSFMPLSVRSFIQQRVSMATLPMAL